MGCAEIAPVRSCPAPGTEQPSVNGLPAPPPISPCPYPALPRGRLGFWLARQPSPWWRKSFGGYCRKGASGPRLHPSPKPQLASAPTAPEAPGQEERKGLRSNARAPPRWGPGGREGGCLPALPCRPSPQTECRPQAPAIWTGGGDRLGRGWARGWVSLNVFTHHLLPIQLAL